MNHAKKLLIAALLLPATVAFAANAGTIIKQRQANFSVMGKSMKAIGDELKSPNVSIATIRTNTKILHGAAKKVSGHFPKGTGPASGIKTDALPVIWTNNKAFKASAAKLVGATNTLNNAAAKGDMAGIKAAMGGVGGTCGSCHDSFRKPRG
jgi:cytochrome c556